MIHKVRWFSLVVYFLLGAGLVAQQALTNDSVIKLVNAGLGEEMIIGMVKAQPSSFSTGAGDVIALKQAGVSEKIISAMIQKAHASAAPSAAAQAAPPASALPSEIGVYYKKGEQWIEVLPEVVNWKTGGVLKTIATAGVVKGDVNGRLNGPNSRNSVSTPLEFLIYAPEGAAITEYQLIRLRRGKDGREFRTITGGVLHVSGGATRDLVPFEGKKLASRTYSVALPNLDPGEYGFLSPGSYTSSHASAQLGKMYTFRFLE